MIARLAARRCADLGDRLWLATFFGTESDVEAEGPAVVEAGWIEELPDRHPHAHGRAEQLVDRDVAVRLSTADGGPAPTVREPPSSGRQLTLGHVPQHSVGAQVHGRAPAKPLRRAPRRLNEACGTSILRGPSSERQQELYDGYIRSCRVQPGEQARLLEP